MIYGLSLGLGGIEKYSAEGGEDLSRFRNGQFSSGAYQSNRVPLAEWKNKTKWSRPATHALISGLPRVATPVTRCV